MVAAHRPKSPDKQEVCRKVVALLKKAYPSSVPKRELPVLETMMYAVCLEDATFEQADAVYAKLLNAFHDLNEVRVSSITELLPVFGDQEGADWRALRIKSTLQYVFETNYAFDFESLKKKTAELATKQLSKIHGLSPFVRSYVMQHSLGSHVLPIDGRTLAALVWLGLVEPNSTPEHAGEALRSFVRKADAPAFCHYVHCLANDSKRVKTFAAALTKPPAGDEDPVARLDHLLKRGDMGAGRARAAKPAAGKASRNGAAHGKPARGKLGTKKRH